MLNRILLMGRLTSDPELRRTGSGIAVTSFTIAVDRDIAAKGQEKETDFISCVAWRNTAEFVNSYFSKGRMIVVDGRLQIRKFTDKNGNNRTAAEVVADSVYFGDSKRDSDNSSAPASYGGYNAPAPSYSAPAGSYGTGGYGGYSAPTGPSDFAMLDEDDGQLPF